MSYFILMARNVGAYDNTGAIRFRSAYRGAGAAPSGEGVLLSIQAK